MALCRFSIKAGADVNASKSAKTPAGLLCGWLAGERALGLRSEQELHTELPDARLVGTCDLSEVA